MNLAASVASFYSQCDLRRLQVNPFISVISAYWMNGLRLLTLNALRS